MWVCPSKAPLNFTAAWRRPEDLPVDAEMLCVEPDLPTAQTGKQMVSLGKSISVAWLEARQRARSREYDGDKSAAPSKIRGSLHLQTPRAPRLGPCTLAGCPPWRGCTWGPQCVGVWSWGWRPLQGGGGERGWGRGWRWRGPGGGRREGAAAAAAASPAATQTPGAAEAVSRSAFPPLLGSRSGAGLQPGGCAGARAPRAPAAGSRRSRGAAGAGWARGGARTWAPLVPAALPRCNLFCPVPLSSPQRL